MYFPISPAFVTRVPLMCHFLTCVTVSEDRTSAPGRSPSCGLMPAPDHSPSRNTAAQLLSMEGGTHWTPQGLASSQVKVQRWPVSGFWPEGKCFPLSVSKSLGRGVHASRPCSDFGLEAQRVGCTQVTQTQARYFPLATAPR